MKIYFQHQLILCPQAQILAECVHSEIEAELNGSRAKSGTKQRIKFMTRRRWRRGVRGGGAQASKASGSLPCYQAASTNLTITMHDNTIPEQYPLLMY